MEEVATSIPSGGRAMRFLSYAGSALLVAAVTVLSTADASAWSRFRDRIYADSFGNLVIQSPSGYKRIVVGQGHLAPKLTEYEGGGDSAVEYYNDGYDGGGYRSDRDCYRPPYLWKGRSHMYGLPDGEIPQPPCADE
jgi:hypothetical protein